MLKIEVLLVCNLNNGIPFNQKQMRHNMFSLSEVGKQVLFCCSWVESKSTTAMMVLPTDVWTAWEERGKTEL